MFAPTPITLNEKFRFELVHADGEKEVLHMPFFDRLQDTEFPGDIRDLKIQQSLIGKQINALKPAFSRYVARCHSQRREGYAPSKLYIIRMSQRRPAWPPENFVPTGQFIEETTYTHHFENDRFWNRTDREPGPL